MKNRNYRAVRGGGTIGLMAKKETAAQRAEGIIAKLRALSKPENLIGMARYGIVPKNGLGVSIPHLRSIAKECGKNHALAQKLWASGIHDVRILAALVDEPEKVSPAQMDRWVKTFYSWDVCDQVCGNLFDKTPYAYDKARVWRRDPREYVKRAGFVLMAVLAVHDKRADDAQFIEFLPMIREGAEDGRNFVKKAVNWALRQIGKRNPALRKKALALAAELAASPDAAPRWVGRGALRELKSISLGGGK